jgi:hypothetical protein
MTPHGDYFTDLPSDTRQLLISAAKRYLGLDSIPDKETALRLLDELHVQNTFLDVQIDWATRARDYALTQSRPWTQDELRRYCAEEGDE